MSTKPGKLQGGRPTRKTPAKSLNDLKQESAEPIVRLNANVPKSWHKRLRQRALDEDITVTELVMKAVDQYMSKSARE